MPTDPALGPSHVVARSRDLAMVCLHCGREYAPALPLESRMYIALVREFGHQHCDCPEPEVPHAD